uniref:Uncharacterized protein n=1 Tax=Catharus ustulatus TaxID=91951 RepID=A0A8C3TWD1_CATUS
MMLLYFISHYEASLKNICKGFEVLAGHLAPSLRALTAAPSWRNKVGIMFRGPSRRNIADGLCPERYREMYTHTYLHTNIYIYIHIFV